MDNFYIFILYTNIVLLIIFTKIKKYIINILLFLTKGAHMEGFFGLVLLPIGILLVGISKNFNDHVEWRITNVVLLLSSALSFFEAFSQNKPLCYKFGVISTIFLLLSIFLEIRQNKKSHKIS